MYFVWDKSLFGALTSYKCNTLPVLGNGKQVQFVAKHELKQDEEHLPISVLNKIYPAPNTE